MTPETLIVGGGCFWCTEAVMQRIKGVTEVQSGYMGGHLAQPRYSQICQGDTGHAEVIRVRFDPAQISLAALLRVFLNTHDPTTLNRQGNDQGTQYRSVIFALGEDQAAASRAALAEWSAAHPGAKPVTELVVLPAEDPLPSVARPVEATFWPAEPEHDNYFNENPGAGYCLFVVAPKVEKSVQLFPELQG